jgi:acyl-CoA hydrolase
MQYKTRKLIKPGDLNARNTLFGGALLKWIDEEAGIYAMTKLDSKEVVTKYMSEIDFVSSAQQGDIIEIGLAFKAIGTSSIRFSCQVRNIFTKQVIIKIDEIVFVNVDKDGKVKPHGKTIENLGFEYEAQANEL